MSEATRQLAAALVRGALRGDPARALPHLVVRPPGGEERAVALQAELTVGRGGEAGLVLPDGGASRLHARIRLADDGTARVEDLGSKNGLRLNGAPLGAGPAPLRPGDELLVGGTVLRFEDPLAAGGAGAPAPAGDGAPRATAMPGLRLAVAAGLLGLAALLLAVG